jgi:hypothetical protein
MKLVLKSQTYDGGRTDVECTRCQWSLPGISYRGHGFPNPGTEYADRMIPGEISNHIRDTGHAIRINLITFHADGRVEQSATRISPRAEGR